MEHTPSPDSAHTSTSLPFSGLALTLARAVWIFVALLSAISFALFLPYASDTLRAVGDWRRAAMFMSGIQPDAYASYYVLLMLIFAALHSGTALFIFWRQSAERMAWLISLLLFTFGSGGALSLLPDTVRSAAQTSAPLLAIIAVIDLSLFYSLFLVFPDGRFVPAWTRWLLPPLLLFTLSYLFPPGHPLRLDSFAPTIASALQLGFFTLAVGAQIHRRRHTAPGQRQQTQGLVFGLSIAAAIQWCFFLLPVVFPVLRPPTVPVVALAYEMLASALFLTFIIVPLAIIFSGKGHGR
ncbi:MAG: hypothetical protein HXY40_17660 [Chloroflexi bacterium]|nr:hypothetical protein [Chloroflexota bacterium]